MFKRMNLAVGALALTLCLGAGAGVYAQDQQNNPAPTPGASNPAAAQDQQANPQQTNPMNGSDMGRRGRRRARTGEGMTGGTMTGAATPVVGQEPTSINWSRQYELTPLDQKRLQAMGLTKEEAWATARAAHEANEDVDTVADMRLRGRTYWQIADELNVPYDSLFKWPERWQSAEWADAVKAGSPFWYAHSASMTGATGGMNQGGMR